MKEFEIKEMSVFYDDDFQMHVRELIKKGGCRIKVTALNATRTIPQNSSLHLWLTQMATEMNDAGLTNRKVWEKMAESFDIPVTMEMLKDIAQNVSFDMFKKKHTSELTTIEMQKLYETLNSAFGQSVGVSIPWPSRESLSDGQR